MNTVLRFLHGAGYSIWLGAQLTFMVWVPVSRTVALEPWAHVWKTLAKLQRWIVAPAAVVATLTGFALTMQLGDRPHDAALIGMMVCGVLAALAGLAVVAPLSNRMAWVAEQSLADGERDPAAEPLRRRLAVAGTVTGLLILAAIWFGVIAPPAGGAQ
jgi:putative copper export protein